MINCFLLVLSFCSVVFAMLLMACEYSDMGSETCPEELDSGAFKLNVPGG